MTQNERLFNLGNAKARQFLIDFLSKMINEFGLDWLIVVVVPESDFMAQINQNTRQTFWFSMLALLTALGIGLITANWITRPILDINNAAKKLAGGEWKLGGPALPKVSNGPDSISLPLDRTDELGELANSFDNMAHRLQESFITLQSSERKYRRLFGRSQSSHVQS